MYKLNFLQIIKIAKHKKKHLNYRKHLTIIMKAPLCFFMYIYVLAGLVCSLWFIISNVEIDISLSNRVLNELTTRATYWCKSRTRDRDKRVIILINYSIEITIKTCAERFTLLLRSGQVRDVISRGALIIVLINSGFNYLARDVNRRYTRLRF